MKQLIYLGLILLFSCGHEEEKQPCKAELYYQSREPFDDHKGSVIYSADEIPESCLLSGVPISQLKLGVEIFSKPSVARPYQLILSDRVFDLKDLSLSDGNLRLTDVELDDVGLVSLGRNSEVSLLFKLPNSSSGIPWKVSIIF